MLKQANKVQVTVDKILHPEEYPDGTYVLILDDKNNKAKIPIVIGQNEAQSISLALENKITARPLTHDLIKNFIQGFSIEIQEVQIYDIKDEVFYALLVCLQGKKKKIIDSRSSDAIALALRVKAPIFCNKEIIQKVGIFENQEEDFEEDNEIEKIPISKPKGKASNLKQELARAIEIEDYERAAEIRDLLKKA